MSSSLAYPGPSSSSSVSAPFAPPDELPGDMVPDALPRDVDPSSAVLDSVRSEFRRMLSLIVDLFPQAAGSPSAPPPRTLFEDSFGASTPSSSPVFLNWFERVRTALSDADSRMASFLATGRGDFSFLPPWNSSYGVHGHGEFESGQAVPVNPSLLSLFERQLKPSLLVGLSIREAAALEASMCAQSETLSHSMWILSGLLAFVRLQNFAPEDSSLFNNLVTPLSKSLAHQATLTASHTTFFLTSISVLCSPLRPFVRTFCSLRRMSLACFLTPRRPPRSGPNSRWLMLLLGLPVLASAARLDALLLGNLHLAVAVGIPDLRLVVPTEFVLTPMRRPLP